MRPEWCWPRTASRVPGSSMRGRPGRSAALCLLAFLSLVPTSGAQGLTLTGVLTGSGNTWDPSEGTDPSSGDLFLAWTRYTRQGQPRAYLRVNSGAGLLLNRRGVGWAWSVDVPTLTVAYQQARRGNSNVRFYDWATHVRTSPGSAVDTPRWEYEPAVSSHLLVYARLNRAAAPDVRRIILEDLSTSQQRVLAVFKGSAAIGTLQSPEVSGDWVTWTSMSGRYTQSSVHRYQVSTGKAYRIRHPAGRLDYLSSIGPDGTVYFLRSRSGCGNHVVFESYTTAGVLSRLGSMPAGRDGGDEMFAAPQPDGSTSLYFDSYKCTATNANGNIYRLDVPVGASAAGSIVTHGSLRPASAPKRFPAAVQRRRRMIEGMS
jgi:hypothetical protein